VNAPITTTVPDRSRFLGGSDAAAVLGVSPWETPVELWRAKTGRKQKNPAPLDPAAERRYTRGHRLEPFIREMAIDKLQSMGLRVELVACNERYVDPEHAFLSCEIDFELRLWGTLAINGGEVVFDGEHINADAKSVSGFARKKWGEVDTEDVPIEYASQFMHGLMITGRRACLVAALRSFDDVDIFWTLRDDETIAAMRAKLVSFWVDHVQADVPPDPLKFDDIKALFPLDNGQATEADEEIAGKVQQLLEIKARIKQFEDAEEALQFEIAELISPNARLTYEGRDIATWKAQNDTRLSQPLLAAAEIYRRDEETGEFQRIANPVAEFTRTKAIRVLRLPKPKKGS
jgi:predicted phage-related endonuclease